MSSATTEPITERFMSVSQVADMFQVTPYTIREWIKDEKLDAVKLGSRWRIKYSSVCKLANIKYGE